MACNRRKQKEGKKTMNQKQAIEYLKSIIDEGDTIYYVVKQVSNSGMYRHITFYKFGVKDEFREGEDRVEPYWLTRTMCVALDYRFKDKTGCMGVSGCGMDMGFSVIHNLGHVLFNDGYKLKHEQL